MIMQLSHFIVDCPNCGRPVELHSRYIGHELACGHCRGEFIVYDDDVGELTATRLNSAEQSLGCAVEPANSVSSNCHTRRPCVPAVWDDKTDSQNAGQFAPDADKSPKAQHQPTVLLVEFRDEVFARIESDMAQAGMRVIRACSATEALKLYGTYKPTLVVVNADQRDQTGWLLAAKLKLVDSWIRVWLYQPRSSARDVCIAEFLEIDELLDYRGNLFWLSDTITRLLEDSREVISETKTEVLSAV